MSRTTSVAADGAAPASAGALAPAFAPSFAPRRPSALGGPGATSYHLRKLESVGLVADTGDGEGKRRVWRAATDSHQWTVSDFAGDEDSETALNWLVRDYSRLLGRYFENWLDVEASWPTPWRDAAGMSDYVVLVTPEQTEALKEDLDKLVAKYRVAGQGDSTARRLALWTVLFPQNLDAPAQG